MIRNNDKAYNIAMTGLMAALSYVVFTFGQIKLTLPGGDATSIHLGNAVCVLGALLIGVLETLTIQYLSPTYKDAVAFAVLILILLVRPAGLLGKNVREKV